VDITDLIVGLGVDVEAAGVLPLSVAKLGVVRCLDRDNEDVAHFAGGGLDA
jgi:hypothetical protein